MSRVQSSLPAKSKAFRTPVPVMTQTSLPSVTGDGDDMFCLLPMRLPPESGRFQITACLLRSTAQNSMFPVARCGRDVQEHEIVPDDRRRSAERRKRQLPGDVLRRAPRCGRPVSVLTPSSDGPRHCGTMMAVDITVTVKGIFDGRGQLAVPPQR